TVSIIGADVMATGINRNLINKLHFLTSERIHPNHFVDKVAKKFDPYSQVFFIGRKNLNRVTPNSKSTTVKIHIVASVLNAHKLLEEVVSSHFRIVHKVNH